MMKRSQTHEVDLDRTDKLPILDGVLLDTELEDDAVRLDGSGETAASLNAGEVDDFVRPSPVDLPSLANSVRSVEARIERQKAEYEALSRSFERVREAESAAAARANALERDLGAARAALEAEQNRSREIEKTLLERAAAVDATTVQVLQSLSERDSQLAVLRLEQSKLQATLEARDHAAAQLQAELDLARGQVTAVAAELKASQAETAAVHAQLKRGESAANAMRSDLAASRSQATSYLELLRTRAWRSGFEQNLLRDMDAKVGAADDLHNALKTERDSLKAELQGLNQKIAAQGAAIEQFRSTASAQAAAFAQQADELKKGERERAEWGAKLASAESAQAQLRTELAARAQELAQARAAAGGNVERITQLESEAENREQEMAVLVAHLQEARRPIQLIEADIRRLKDELAEKADELAAKSAQAKELAEEGEKLRTALDRTRGALEEREFLIRRLERSESNNATALGRIQTSMERLGSVAAGAAGATGILSPEWAAELIRIDGDQGVIHALGRRTRIGRAAGCELQIDSTSVSRHHALILGGPNEAIIEDLNSTNGVIVNGRKVTRQVLADGDLVIIGETQFRYALKPPVAASPG